jgi:hypothetical protein
MSEAYIDGCARGAIRHEGGNAATLGAADWLCLAAAPTFAIMALLTGVPGGGAPEMLCSAASPLSGMVPMYLLMSAFHSVPWLKLISSRRKGLAPRADWISHYCVFWRERFANPSTRLKEIGPVLQKIDVISGEHDSPKSQR